jgi:hypothetical protein
MINHLTFLLRFYLLLYIAYTSIAALILLPLKNKLLSPGHGIIIYSVKFNNIFGYEKMVHAIEPSFN